MFLFSEKLGFVISLFFIGFSLNLLLSLFFKPLRLRNNCAFLIPFLGILQFVIVSICFFENYFSSKYLQTNIFLDSFFYYCLLQFLASQLFWFSYINKSIIRSFVVSLIFLIPKEKFITLFNFIYEDYLPSSYKFYWGNRLLMILYSFLIFYFVFVIVNFKKNAFSEK